MPKRYRQWMFEDNVPKPRSKRVTHARKATLANEQSEDLDRATCRTRNQDEGTHFTDARDFVHSVNQDTIVESSRPTTSAQHATIVEESFNSASTTTSDEEPTHENSSSNADPDPHSIPAMDRAAFIQGT